jgi:glycosyltransferase involved in cell wall biosynthesis
MQQKIVIIHKHSRYTGVSSWVYTVAYYLTKVLGHEVHVVIKDQSNTRYCAMLSKAVQGRIHSSWGGPADVFIFNYKSDAEENKNWRGFKIFVTHGLMFDDYKIPEGMNRVIVQSKRAYDFIKTRCEKVLINQPIDLNRFRPYSSINEELQKVLIVDARSNSFFVDKVMAACGELGVFCQTLGESTFGNNSRFDVETAINKADLVIGYGRSVYESMACGKAVIIYGKNGGDGYVNADTFEKNYESNCSGWGSRTMKEPKEIQVSSIIHELKKYQMSHGEHNRNIAKRFDAKENIKHLFL